MTPFTGSPLDRASAQRSDPGWIAARKSDLQALFLPIWQQKVPVRTDGTALRAGFLQRGAWETLAAPAAPCVFLGLAAGAPRFAIDLSAAAEGALSHLCEFQEMRAAAFALPDADTAILGQAKALIDWHQRHRFCANCGTLTGIADGGWRRHCPQCGAEHFPRTDPVVIMLPIFPSPNGRNDRCLLGRNARFTGGLWSAFAGFLEPGETVEEAVARELAEEADLRVGAVTYRASQFWPFPSSLMIGCFAQAASADFRIDGTEIAEARWMDKTEVCARLAGQTQDAIRLPPPFTIAHHLLKTWAGG